MSMITEQMLRTYQAHNAVGQCMCAICVVVRRGLDAKQKDQQETTGKQAVAEKERLGTHGKWDFQSAISQNLKFLFRKLAPNWDKLPNGVKEPVELICMKISRIVTGNPNEIDHWRDIAGYAELRIRQIKQENERAQMASTELVS